MISAFLICAASSRAASAQEPSIIIAYPLKSGGGNYLQTIKDGLLSLKSPESFKVKAFVEPVTVEKDVVSRRFRPKIGDIIFSPAHNWAFDRKGMSLKKGTTEKGAYGMKIDFSKNSIDIDDYPFFLFSWQQANTLTSPEIDFDFLIDKNDDGRSDFSLKSYYTPKASKVKSVKESDLREAVFESKSIGYVLGRKFGTPLDEKWRYSKYNGVTVVQRRFNTPVSEAGVVIMTFKPGTSLKGINLMLDTDGDGKGDSVVNYNDLVRRQEEGDASIRETIDLFETAKKLGLDTKKVRLSEVIVDLGDDIERVKSERLMERIQFCQKEREQRYTVSSAGGVNYLVFDIRKSLEERGVAEGRITGVTMTFQSDDATQPILIKDMEFFRTVKKAVPVVLDKPLQHLQEFFSPLLPPHLRIESYSVLWWGRDLRFSSGMSLSKDSPRPNSTSLCESIKRVVAGRTTVNKRIEGDLYFRFDTNEKALKNLIEVFYTDPLGKKRRLLRSIPKGNYVYIGVPAGSVLENASILLQMPPEEEMQHDKKQEVLKIDEAILIEVRTVEASDNNDVRGISWVKREGRTPLEPGGGAELVRAQKNEDRFVLTVAPGKKAEGIFAAGNRLQHVKELSFSYEVPESCECREVFSVGRSVFKWDLPQGKDKEVIPMTVDPEGGSVALSVMCVNFSDRPASVTIVNPQVLALGLSEDPSVFLRQEFAKIDDRSYSLNGYSADILKGGRIDLGDILLSPGDHKIFFPDHSLVRMRSLFLEAVSSYSPLAAMQNITGAEPSVLLQIAGKLLTIGMACLAVFVVYRGRKVLKAVLERFLSPLRRVYSFAPDGAWCAIWMIASGGFYLLYVLNLVSSGERGFYLTFGGISFIIGFVHFMRFVEAWLTKHYPRVAGYVYRDRASLFFVGALCMLALMPVLLIVKLDEVAEQLAILVYYFLVIGVTIEVFSLRKRETVEGEDHENNGRNV